MLESKRVGAEVPPSVDTTILTTIRALCVPIQAKLRRKRRRVAVVGGNSFGAGLLDHRNRAGGGFGRRGGAGFRKLCHLSGFHHFRGLHYLRRFYYLRGLHCFRGLRQLQQIPRLPRNPRLRRTPPGRSWKAKTPRLLDPCLLPGGFCKKTAAGPYRKRFRGCFRSV